MRPSENSQIWCSGKYSVQTKLRLFNTNVLSKLCYSSETWHLDQQLERKLLAFEYTCLRLFLNIHGPQFSESFYTTEDVLATDSRGDQIQEVEIPQACHPLAQNSTTKGRLSVAPTWNQRKRAPQKPYMRNYWADLTNLNTSIQSEWEDVWAAAVIRYEARLIWRTKNCFFLIRNATFHSHQRKNKTRFLI